MQEETLVSVQRERQRKREEEKRDEGNSSLAVSNGALADDQRPTTRLYNGEAHGFLGRCGGPKALTDMDTVGGKDRLTLALVAPPDVGG